MRGRDYVDTKELHKALVEYKTKVDAAKANGEPLPGVSNYIGLCIYKIAENTAKRSEFNGYTFVDEMVADAVENCLRYIHNFDPKYPNPFGYISRIVWNAFITRIKTEKKNTAIKFKSMEKMMIFNEGSGISNEDAHLFQSYFNEIQRDITGPILENNEPKKVVVTKKSTANNGNTITAYLGVEDESN